MESGIYVCVCDGMLLMCVLCVYVLLMDDAVVLEKRSKGVYKEEFLPVDKLWPQGKFPQDA